MIWRKTALSAHFHTKNCIAGPGAAKLPKSGSKNGSSGLDKWNSFREAFIRGPTSNFYDLGSCDSLSRRFYEKAHKWLLWPWQLKLLIKRLSWEGPQVVPLALAAKIPYHEAFISLWAWQLKFLFTRLLLECPQVAPLALAGEIPITRLSLEGPPVTPLALAAENPYHKGFIRESTGGSSGPQNWNSLSRGFY